jgi:transcriptional repressor NrdR
MRCPYCSFDSTRVVDSRLTEPGEAVRRRRECAGCGARFTTYERSEGIALAVRKRDGRLEPFDRDKLLGGLLRAATKRPIEVSELEAVADSIASEVRRGGGEADAERIGELALRGLIRLDRVAAIRFASVYRRFEDLAEFEAELRRLEAEPVLLEDQLALASEGAIPSDPEASIRLSPAGPPRGAKEGRNPRRRAHAEHP